MCVREGDPKAIGTKRVEVPDFSSRILCFGRAASEIDEMLNDGVPITLEAKIMGHGTVPKMYLTALEGGFDPSSAGAELYVTDFHGIDGNHVALSSVTDVFATCSSSHELRLNETLSL